MRWWTDAMIHSSFWKFETWLECWTKQLAMLWKVWLLTSFEQGCGRRLNWELMLQYCHHLAWLLFLVSVHLHFRSGWNLVCGRGIWLERWPPVKTTVIVLRGAAHRMSRLGVQRCWQVIRQKPVKKSGTPHKMLSTTSLNTDELHWMKTACVKVWLCHGDICSACETVCTGKLFV